MAKIKHIAMICMDPNKLADFYCDVFDMKVQLRRNGSVFLTDGYLNVALLAQTAEGKPNGLNHFGFHIENADVVAERMKKWNVVGPVQASGRPHLCGNPRHRSGRQQLRSDCWRLRTVAPVRRC